MRLLLIFALGVTFLAGCAGPDKRAKKAIGKHAPYCEALGHKPDTDAWRQCIQKEDERATRD